MRNMSHIKHIVIKIGSSSLCDESGKIDKEKLLKLIMQIVYMKQKGIKVVLVTSGAISTGIGILDLKAKPIDMVKKQALAAIGQAHLMHIYEDLFGLFHIKCGQILLNHDDFHDLKRVKNLRNTIHSILEYDVIPIINENDTLAVEEIKVGDNDTLSALVTNVIHAQLLIIVSHIDGLYNDNPSINKNALLIHEVHEINDEIMSYAKDTMHHFGTGGMITKLNAAKIVKGDMVIVNGQKEHALIDCIEGKEIGTYFKGERYD